MPSINAARAAKARARLEQANSTLQHGEAATLTMLRGGVPVVGWESVPCVVRSHEDDTDIDVVVRRSELPTPLVLPDQGEKVRVSLSEGAVIVYKIAQLDQADALGTAYRLRLSRTPETQRNV